MTNIDGVAVFAEYSALTVQLGRLPHEEYTERFANFV